MKRNEIPAQMQYYSMVVRYSREANEWLCGHTINDEGRTVSHCELFQDLLGYLNFFPYCDESFHRPIEVQPGQTQFSELHLAERWRMGRKKVHNLLSTMQELKLIRIDGSRSSSVISYICVESWSMTGKDYVKNPYYGFHRPLRDATEPNGTVAIVPTTDTSSTEQE